MIMLITTSLVTMILMGTAVGLLECARKELTEIKTILKGIQQKAEDENGNA